MPPGVDRSSAQLGEDDDTPSNHHSGRRDSVRIRNHLLGKAFPTWFDDNVYFQAVTSNRWHNNNLQSAIVSSGYTEGFMQRLAEAWVNNNTQRTESPPRDLATALGTTGLFKAQGAVENPFLHTDASWLHMHVSDPPVRKVGLFQGNSGSGDEDTIREIAYPDGLRMGQFYALVLACSRLLNCGYRIQIQWPQEPLGHLIGRYAESLDRDRDTDMGTSATVNQGLMRADVLVLVARGFPVEMAEPTDEHERSLIGGGFVFFMEQYGDEFERLGNILTKPRMEQYLGYYFK